MKTELYTFSHVSELFYGMFYCRHLSQHLWNKFLHLRLCLKLVTVLYRIKKKACEKLECFWGRKKRSLKIWNLGLKFLPLLFSTWWYWGIFEQCSPIKININVTILNKYQRFNPRPTGSFSRISPKCIWNLFLLQLQFVCLILLFSCYIKLSRVCCLKTWFIFPHSLFSES